MWAAVIGVTIAVVIAYAAYVSLTAPSSEELRAMIQEADALLDEAKALKKPSSYSDEDLMK